MPCLAGHSAAFALSPGAMGRIRGFRQENGLVVCMFLKRPNCSVYNAKWGGVTPIKHYFGGSCAHASEKAVAAWTRW